VLRLIEGSASTCSGLMNVAAPVRPPFSTSSSAAVTSSSSSCTACRISWKSTRRFSARFRFSIVSLAGSKPIAVAVIR
jgi:hypothetical protein